MPSKAKSQTAVHLDHVALEVRDVEASAEFYRKILKFEPVRMKEYRAGDAPFASARINQAVLIDFFPKTMWNNRRKAANPNHICFTFAEKEIAALKRRMARAKVKITRRLPLSYGAQGWGNSIYFADPDGVILEARFYGKDAKKDLSAQAQKAQAKTALKMIDKAKGKG